jgi:predicted PhzF superfamily epimerase YddE/YHI9
MVSAPADPGRPYEVVSRFFAPGSGIPEDPTTGSAHCILAPLFADRLGKSRIRFHQAFPGRGGDLEAEVRGDRVLLGGTAVTVIESRLRL